MKRLPSLLGALVVTASLAACADSPTQVDQPTVSMAVYGAPGWCPAQTTVAPTGKGGIGGGADRNNNGYVCVGTTVSKNGRSSKVIVDDTI